MRPISLALSVALASPAAAQITVAVDPTADVHPISPLVYGLNYAGAAEVDAGVTLTRWGGNSTSRYNWQIDVTNTGADWYFENVAGCWDDAHGWCSTPPSDPKAESGANAFLEAAAGKGMTAFFTIPALGYVAKAPPAYAHPLPCGCPRSANPDQQSFDPWDADCGNGKAPNGQPVSCPDPATTTSVAFGASDAREWVTYLVGRFGPSDGKRIYLVDNEPNLWNSTHWDVHPQPTTYEELWQKTRDTAAALLAADPTAEVGGPAAWGWPAYFCSALDLASPGYCSAQTPDRKAHGGEALVPWLLDQARAYEEATGIRILHYLDLHYYPQGGSAPENLRSLWDPTYVDPSWIRDVAIEDSIVRLVPRMREWVAGHYPGTKISVSEYAWPNQQDSLGAVTYAEVLGIFGREQLDAATAWGGPRVGDRAFAAFKLYRDYDGAAGRFADTSVRATVSGADFQAFAAKDAGRLTVALVNEGAARSVAVTLGAFEPASSAQWYRIADTGDDIVRQADAAVSTGRVEVEMPAQSIGMLVVPGADASAGGGGGSGGAASRSGGCASASAGPFAWSLIALLPWRRRRARR
jgi:hypothetical protein